MDHIGIDVHKRQSQICVLTAEGEIVERTVQTTRERFAAVLGSRAAAQVLIEASTESEWVAQCLEALGHTVIVADPNYAPMYGGRRRRIKTNRRDAAQLARASAQGIYRPAHRVSATQRAVRQQLTVRETLVRARTRAIAVARAGLRSEGLRLASGASETFAARVARLPVPMTVQSALQPLLDLITQLSAQITTADERVASLADADAVARRLQTAPGVGPVTAAAFVATLDRIDRFRDAHQVESYLGLVPGERSSADYQRRGRITKTGNPRMRWLLVQAAWAIWQSPSADAAPLRAWAHRIAARRGKSIAAVALARRLAGILYALWRDETTYATARLGARQRPAA